MQCAHFTYSERRHVQLGALARYNGMDRDTIFDELRNFALLLKALSAAMERRAQRTKSGRDDGDGGSGQPTLFDHPEVLNAFRTLSHRFTAALREAGSTGLLKEAGISSGR